GVFQPGERLELIDGLLVVREPQGSRHAGTIRRVLAALRRALGDSWQIDSQLPIALDADSEPEPDVAVVPRDPGTYLDAHPSRAMLIVEVAENKTTSDHRPRPRHGRGSPRPRGVSGRPLRLALPQRGDAAPASDHRASRRAW